MTTYRNICLTIFKYSKDTFPQSDFESIFSYCIYQEESCPKTGKPHIQFYGELSKRKSLRQIKKFFNDQTVHIEERFGTQKQCIEYCSKEETRIGEVKEHGSPREQGRRTDLNYIRDMVKSGHTIENIVDSMERISYQAVKLAITLKTVYSRPRTEKPVVIWIYGATGIGKTRYVYEHFKDIYTKNMSKWWDGYEQQQTILIDDYRKDLCKFHELLTLTDRYTCQREVKCGSVQINSKYIIFTSPKGPLETWEYRTNEDLLQLKRRIDYIIDMESENIDEILPLMPTDPPSGDERGDLGENNKN